MLWSKTYFWPRGYIGKICEHCQVKVDWYQCFFPLPLFYLSFFLFVDWIRWRAIEWLSLLVAFSRVISTIKYRYLSSSILKRCWLFGKDCSRCPSCIATFGRWRHSNGIADRSSEGYSRGSSSTQGWFTSHSESGILQQSGNLLDINAFSHNKPWPSLFDFSNFFPSIS